MLHVLSYLRNCSERSSLSGDFVFQVLKLCNASVADYKCVFTSGATAALKLVGEAFPWTRSSHYMYTMENHNSVLGLREYPPHSISLGNSLH